MITNASVYLFSDGSCGSKDDIGAWASIICSPHDRKLLYGVVNPTTIGRMELVPIIEGMCWLKKNWAKYLDKVTLHISTDSEYVAKTISGLYTPHKNMDLWHSFYEISKHYIITCEWHSRNTLPYMAHCDSICSTLREKVKDISNQLFGDYRHPENYLPFEGLT